MQTPRPGTTPSPSAPVKLDIHDLDVESLEPVSGGTVALQSNCHTCLCTAGTDVANDTGAV